MLNKKCIIRLSRYKNALKRLKALGFVKVFSGNLADAAGVSSSQVRKDFSVFGIKGNRRGGYKVDELIPQMEEILGKKEQQNAVVVGLGNIGKALLRYKGFQSGGIHIAAAFDIDPEKYNSSFDVQVLPMENFREFVQEHKIRIAVLAVPEVAAHHVSEIMISAGIKGILNFAPIRLRCADDVIVSNINLEVELENLIYFAALKEKEALASGE